VSRGYCGRRLRSASSKRRPSDRTPARRSTERAERAPEYDGHYPADRHVIERRLPTRLSNTFGRFSTGGVSEN